MQTACFFKLGIRACTRITSRQDPVADELVGRSWEAAGSHGLAVIGMDLVLFDLDILCLVCHKDAVTIGYVPSKMHGGGFWILVGWAEGLVIRWLSTGRLVFMVGKTSINRV